jgi:hypothetical protein
LSSSQYNINIFESDPKALQSVRSNPTSRQLLTDLVEGKTKKETLGAWMDVADALVNFSDEIAQVSFMSLYSPNRMLV